MWGKVQKIMDLLDSDKMVRVNGCDMWLTPDKHYIAWHHFGSSANLKTEKDLYWILCNIAGEGKVYINEDRSVYGLNPKLTEIE